MSNNADTFATTVEHDDLIRMGMCIGDVALALDHEGKGIFLARNRWRPDATRYVEVLNRDSHLGPARASSGPIGGKLIRCAFAGHEAAMERGVAGLNAEERKQAGRLLRKLGLSAKAMLAER